MPEAAIRRKLRRARFPDPRQDLRGELPLPLGRVDGLPGFDIDKRMAPVAGDACLPR